MRRYGKQIVHWRKYKACDTCGAKKGYPCFDLRTKNSSSIHETKTDRPHKGRTQIK